MLKSSHCCDVVFLLNATSVLDILDMLNKFCPPNGAGSQYQIKPMGNSEQPNFYSKEGTSVRVIWKIQKSGGTRCLEYQDLLEPLVQT